jgi:hypothetical protein
MALLPTERLNIVLLETDDEDLRNEDSVNQIVEFGAKLLSEGKRAWFEVWYPNTTAETYDAVEVFSDGSFETLPPYTELV